ncbi:hypothetical protein D3C73_367660 [compost metagenome]
MLQIHAISGVAFEGVSSVLRLITHAGFRHPSSKTVRETIHCLPSHILECSSVFVLCEQ